MPNQETQTADDAFAEVMASAVEDSPQDTPVTEKIKIGDDEFTPEELSTLIADGRRAKEIEKGGREKFDQAAQREAALADQLEVVHAWKNGTPEERQALTKVLAKECGLSIAEMKEQITDLVEDLDDPTKNESALAKRNAELQRRLDAMEARLAHVDGTLKAAIPALNEIREYASSEKEARQIQADISAIHAKGYVNITGEQIKEWRDGGIPDPVKAIDVLAPMLNAAVKEGADKARKQEEVPSQARSKTVDPDDPTLTADDLFRAYKRGEIPA